MGPLRALKESYTGNRSNSSSYRRLDDVGVALYTCSYGDERSKPNTSALPLSNIGYVRAREEPKTRPIVGLLPGRPLLSRQHALLD